MPNHLIKIKRVTDSFLPQSDYDVVFPCGVTKAYGNILIAYGEGDAFNKILQITSAKLKEILYDVEELKTREYKLVDNLL